jgi:hypothetical protein
MASAIKICSLRFAHIFSKKKEKTRKKEKRKPLCRHDGAACQGFLRKILPDKGGWRFFEKPEGLDLYWLPLNA